MRRSHCGGNYNNHFYKEEEAMKRFFIGLTAAFAALIFGAVSAYAATNVWFHNSHGWSDVSIYVWVDGIGDISEIGGWPGKPAVRDGSSDWWSFTVHNELPIHVIFNDSGAGSQAEDVYVTQQAADIYLIPTSGDVFTNRADAELAAGAFVPEPPRPVTGETTRVYFHNSAKWEIVYVYVWGAEIPDPLGGWPGTPAVSDGGDWVYIDVASNAPFNPIFHDGMDGGRADVFVPDGEHVYFILQNDAVFTSKAAATGGDTADTPTAPSGSSDVKGDSPKTGNNAFALIFIAFAALVCAGAGLVILRKRALI
jgi:LPXTG-motif cell wall-anchored protein